MIFDSLVTDIARKFLWLVRVWAVQVRPGFGVSKVELRGAGNGFLDSVVKSR